MTPLSSIAQFNAIYNILFTVALVTLLTWRLKFPVTLGLIIAGILSSFSTRIIMPELSPELFIAILLPPILYQEALHLNVDALIKEFDTIIFFSILGTLIMQLLITLISTTLLGFTLLEGLLFGTLLAPTDPVAVIRTFHSLGVNKRFEVIVSGESLFNDGVSIVVFLVLTSMITKGTITFGDLGQLITVTIFGGIVIGYLSGYVVHALYCWTDDKFFKVLVSLMACFGIFKIAEEFGASGVIATVVSGLILNYRVKRYGGLGVESYEMLEIIWELMGFLASSLAFIFIGMHLNQFLFRSYLLTSLGVLLAIIFFRFLMVETLTKTLEKTRKKKFPRNWKDGFMWSGLKGAVSIVLVLSITGLIENSDIISSLTFGVVILSNILQGMTMGSVITDRGLSNKNLAPDKKPPELLQKDKYFSNNYDRRANVYTKIVFSLPEYIISDTKYGAIISNRLVRLLEKMNIYAIEEIPITTIGWINRLLNLSSRIIFVVLNWINQFVLNKELEMGYSIAISDFFENITKEFTTFTQNEE